MSRKILLADDSVTIRKVVELTFMEEDYELEATADGRAAVEQLDIGAPDLVIADVHMPEVDGFDVARESKKRYPNVPVLLLVGTFEPFDPADVEACGADEYLKKPFDSQDLLRQVGRLLERSPSLTSDGQEPDTGADEGAVEVDSQEAPEVPVPAQESDQEGDQVDSADDVVTPQAEFSDADIDRIARRVAELLSDGVVREVAWDVIPDLAEIVIKDRLRELESQVE